uniref:Fatty acyl-CoA reductase n=1 Tax=Nicotiana sylvestris TaxID=4096 RepID=A0A1U7VTQ6_NICSY|nr:PREDICTED: probable fatty acyl-CoA reductase 5 [Nicotiana sylvestris]
MVLQGKATWMAKHILVHKSNGRDDFRTLEGESSIHNLKAINYIKLLQGAFSIPGWIEGLRTGDIFVVGYGKGKQTVGMGDKESIIMDVISKTKGGVDSDIMTEGRSHKVLTEKILRVQPNVKKLYLLIRATYSISAKQRFTNEVLKNDLFGVLRERLGANLHSVIEDKIFPVAGDIACDSLGINSALKMRCKKNILLHAFCRYDTAIRINALGALNVLKFTKQCSKLMMLLHVSTAYVCGEKEGLILEKPLHYGEMLSGGSHLDIDAEQKLAEETLKDLKARNATEKEVTLAMRLLGIERAKIHGWPNTYSITKAMEEMLLGQLKENL